MTTFKHSHKNKIGDTKINLVQLKTSLHPRENKNDRVQEISIKL